VLDDVTDFCRLILLRHPELAQEHRNLAVGAGSASLSRRGRARVLHWLRVLEQVPVERVFTSDQPQCLEPAQGVAEMKQADLIQDQRLRDQAMGKWQGRAWDDLMQVEPDKVSAFFQDFGETPAPAGESLGQAVERMLSWWTEVSPQGAGRTFAVVASGGMLTGFAAAMLGMRLSRCVSLNLPHGGMGILELFANGARIATWNPDALVEVKPPASS
jgi:broad specificity phosphatase PhoE